jgi:hypothetical protein
MHYMRKIGNDVVATNHACLHLSMCHCERWAVHMSLPFELDNVGTQMQELMTIDDSHDFWMHSALYCVWVCVTAWNHSITLAH